MSEGLRYYYERLRGLPETARLLVAVTTLGLCSLYVLGLVSLIAGPRFRQAPSAYAEAIVYVTSTPTDVPTPEPTNTAVPTDTPEPTATATAIPTLLTAALPPRQTVEATPTQRSYQPVPTATEPPIEPTATPTKTATRVNATRARATPTATRAASSQTAPRTPAPVARKTPRG